MKLCSRLLSGALIVLISSCTLDDDPGFSLLTQSFDFTTSPHDWVAGFSDFPADADSSFYELTSDYTTVPGTSSSAFMIAGNNHSDDLFMYLKKNIGGLEPNSEYVITFEVKFASEAKESAVGVGGAPGKSVFMKVGASDTEPKTLIENNYYVLNIDKGNQAQSGEDMIVIGDIAIPESSQGFTIVTRTNGPYANNSYNTPVVVSSNSQGELWLIVGTDSGFEGLTTLYYTNITAVLSKSN